MIFLGTLSPLIGIAGVNSLLFASYAASKRIISPFPDKSLKEIAAAGAMAGAANAILASPGENRLAYRRCLTNYNSHIVEILKTRCNANIETPQIKG